jgi:hypothetical protein
LLCNRAWVSLKYGRSGDIVAATSRRCRSFLCAPDLCERQGIIPGEWDLP